MPDRAAPRVFVTYSHDTPEHKKLVERFAAFLRTGIGLDVHLDAWYDNVRRDWSLWATEQLTKADFIVVVASPDYKRRADGTALPHEGRGAQFEAAIIRDNLTRDLRRETERVLPVVLPGRSIDEIPVFLNAHSTTRYHVDEFTEAGVADLLAAITGQGQYPMPRRGRWRGGAREEQHEPASEVPWLHASKGVKREAAGIDGVRYEQSIVLRPTSPPAPGPGYVELDLGGNYRRFTTVAGVLDDAADPFQVGRVRVVLDGTPRSEHDVSAGKPAVIDLDVTGARVLRVEMSRPGTPASPLRSGAWVTTPRNGRPPELALGDPTMT
ncbi:SEFIR domain-containing protein [Amycolatopsis sp. Hca4]|uniref:SEFIR domain-containing protein n=1 Tax=unclassified Amycolatopsis TaxID=2618356 RepID=UPI0015909942|nr:SEFIR domain-containing protein [Amycolatopsis sp. Hca4]QKV72924.1 TIR domain-containing protein [Amycolatopsis sp. Hca4]